MNTAVMDQTPLGLMLHHFHGGIHPVGQGSISADDFSRILDFLGPRKLLRAEEWLEKLVKGRLKPGETCITLDDGLLCQYDIALPVLDSYNLTAFWYPYTSPLIGKIESLEVYRYFRTVYFNDMEDFYNCFFLASLQSIYSDIINNKLHGFDPNLYLNQFSFYTPSDRKYRYIRDQILNSEQMADIMNQLMAKFNVSPQELSPQLWMNSAQIAELSHKGHIIGLHSHTHPTTMAKLPPESQENEYKKCREILEDLLQKNIFTMSHPCNSYSEETLQILDSMDIKLGFTTLPYNPIDNNLTFPRLDHCLVVEDINKL